MSPQVPSHSSELTVSFPQEHVLLLSFNRPKSLNAMTPTMERDLQIILRWFDNEVSLWVVVITGVGRVFCAGADLIAWRGNQDAGLSNDQERIVAHVHGFGAISRRRVSSKPMIAAVNGGAYGGGLEMVLNCDLVVAGHDTKFALPEVKRGVVAAQGAIPRLSQIAGHQLASELLLTGKTISAGEARDRFNFVNFVVPPADVLPAALRLAEEITKNSPDAVQSTKHGIMLSQELPYEQAVITHAWSTESERTYIGENIKEGLRAFGEKRVPVWKNPAKL